MQLLLIRHGQSAWQLNHSLGPNSEITALGVLQSHFLNSYIKETMNENSNKWIVYVSPLKRALQTVESLDEEYIIDSRISEASFHVASRLPQYAVPHFYKKNYATDHRYKWFKSKINDLLEEILELKSNDKIYLYTHGGVIKTILRIIHDNDSICYTVNNCSITNITWFRSRWHLKKLNDVSFLPKDLVT